MKKSQKVSKRDLEKARNMKKAYADRIKWIHLIIITKASTIRLRNSSGSIGYPLKVTE